jgi:signal transduction histidine kinase
MSTRTSVSTRSDARADPRLGRYKPRAIEQVRRPAEHSPVSTSTVGGRLHANAVDFPRRETRAGDALRRQVFIAAATHDLKTPLCSLTLWIDALQVLKPRLESRGDAQAFGLFDQALEQMQTLVQRSVDLVEQVLDVTRLQYEDALPFALSEVDIVALTRQVLAGHPQYREQQLRLESAQSELWGCWDADRLTRVVENLVANAIKYSPAGQPVTVRVMLHHIEDEPWGILQVADHGIGIPADELPKIFEPFHRAPNVTPTITGYGLGLWGCRTIVEQHGGILTVVSHEGEGTTVTVWLPTRASTPAVGPDLGRHTLQGSASNA